MYPNSTQGLKITLTSIIDDGHGGVITGRGGGSAGAIGLSPGMHPDWISRWMMTNSRSSELFAAAQKIIPGGVNSPVRAFCNVGGDPFFVDRAKGARIWDVDGNEYIDYVGSWGPAILGHAPDVIVDLVRKG